MPPVSPQPTSAVNPGPENLAALASRPDDDAIIMVNLLRYKADGGREAYAEYGAVAYGTVTARGGSIAYSAPVIDPEADWDTVTLVRYPRRAAYLDMQSDPAYVGAIPDRTRGLAARLLHPFPPLGGDSDDPFRIQRSGGEEVFVVALVRVTARTDTWKPEGPVVLHLRADVPLVSDDHWDELVVWRYPALDAVPDALPAPDVAACIRLVTAPGAAP